MSKYETLPGQNFLGLDDQHSGFERSAALILPIPYESTVSYGQGTREGPRAILEASSRAWRGYRRDAAGTRIVFILSMYCGYIVSAPPRVGSTGRPCCVANSVRYGFWPGR